MMIDADGVICPKSLRAALTAIGTPAPSI